MSKKQLNVEVLCTDGYTPGDFGYPYFVVEDKTMLPFSVTVKTEGTLTTADLIVTYGDSIYTKSLIAGNNNIWIDKSDSSYTVIVQKDGYVPFSETFTKEELWGKHFYIELSQVDISLYTLLLLNGDGVQGQTTFYDSSTYQHTITPYGNVITDTSIKKFGSASIYFDGDGDYLTIPQSEDFNFGKQDFYNRILGQTLKLYLIMDGQD